MQLYVPALAPLYQKVEGYAYPLIRIITGLCLIPRGAQELLEWFGGKRAAVAGFKVHLGNGFFWTKAGYEYPLPWGVVALGLVFGGKCLVDEKLGNEF